MKTALLILVIWIIKINSAGAIVSDNHSQDDISRLAIQNFSLADGETIFAGCDSNTWSLSPSMTSGRRTNIGIDEAGGNSKPGEDLEPGFFPYGQVNGNNNVAGCE